MRIPKIFTGISSQVPNINIKPLINTDYMTFYTQSINESIKAKDEHNARKDEALFNTAEAAKEQTELLKAILGSYEIITEQNEKQVKENVVLKRWTIAGVVIMVLTLITTIIIPIIINHYSKGGG